MAYIGKSPTAAPLTSSDVADGIISTAKLADDAVTKPKLDDAIDTVNYKNKLINGDMAIAQRGTSFTSSGSANNDDTYHLDRWYVLSDTNDVVDITQSSTAPTNQLYSCALDVETANKKFGIAQIIENKNCTGLIGQTATLSFKAKASAVDKLDNVKCAIISWSSTADAVTSDLVSAWGVEGTNPTLASNLTYENTPANLSVTTSWATYSVSAAIDTSSTTNVAVFIWSDVTDTTAGQFLYITDVQLEVAAAASDFEFLPYDVNLARCQRYFQTSFEPGTTPTNGESNCVTKDCSCYADNGAYFGTSLFCQMRADPTCVYYTSNNGSATGNKISYYNGSWTNGNASNTILTPNYIGASVSMSSSNNDSFVLQYNYTFDAEL